MGLITEAGFAGIAIVFVFALGVFATVRAKDALWAAMAGTMGVASFAMLGVGLGQRLVDEAVQKVPELPLKVQFLSIGTREADANLLLGGICGLALMALGLAVSAARR